MGYLHDYVSENKLDRYIHLSNRVISLSLSGNETPGGYRHRAVVRHVGRGSNEGNESTILARRVIITTGLHVTPNIPHIPGLNAKPLPTKSTHSASTSTSTTDTHTHTETLPPSWIHSSEYKSRSQLTGKNVLVLGTGETGMDVGYEAIMSGASKVWMGFRGGFLSFPKVLNNFRVLGTTFEGNLPIDGLITNLFETAYVHPWVSASHLRWFVSDFVIKRVLWVLTGTQAGCNQWAGELPPERQGRAYVFLNKSAKAMQFINRPYFKMSPFHRLFAHYIDPPVPSELNNGDPTIHLVPFPTSFDHNGAAIFPPPPPHRSKEIAWKDTCRPNLVILCTGYTQHWDWLGPGYPRGPDDCDIRGVSSSTDLTVGFIGFLRPGVGAIPPMAEMQAQFFLLLTKGQIAIPTSPETYHLLHTPTSRIQYGVDYSTYMAQLARDMGSAPSLWQLISEHGWFITFVYWYVHPILYLQSTSRKWFDGEWFSFGAAFPTFFRLVGPYKSNKAPTIVKTELWETIKRRGVAGNIFMGVIPMVSVSVGLICLATAPHSAKY